MHFSDYTLAGHRRHTNDGYWAAKEVQERRDRHAEYQFAPIPMPFSASLEANGGLDSHLEESGLKTPLTGTERMFELERLQSAWCGGADVPHPDSYAEELKELRKEFYK